MNEILDQDEWFVQESNEQTPRKVTVLDMLNPLSPKTDRETRDNRLAACHACERILPGSRCAECHCFMRAKTWLAEAECPLGKWGRFVEVSTS